MEFSQDEVRRGLADARRAQDDALPRWREALTRVFDPSAKFSAEAKRQVLGLPDRRSFLRVGGMTVAMTAVIAACGGKKDEPVPLTGGPPTSSERTGLLTPGQELDVTFLRTAQSVEVLAVETYQTALDSGLLTTPTLADTIRLFQDQHREHAGLLSATTIDAGGTPYDEPNSYLAEQVVAPAVAELTDESSVVALALELENTAAQTYVFAAEVLSVPALRQAIMSIGGVEARHVSVLYTVQEQPPVPFAFMPARARVPADGYVPPDGPLTPTTPPPGSGDESTGTTTARSAAPSGTAAN
jgi:hypothetical protein